MCRGIHTGKGEVGQRGTIGHGASGAGRSTDEPDDPSMDIIDQEQNADRTWSGDRTRRKRSSINIVRDYSQR